MLKVCPERMAPGLWHPVWAAIFEAAAALRAQRIAAGRDAETGEPQTDDHKE